MNSLAINRVLDESTRSQEIVVNDKVYSLHMSLQKDEVIITDTYDYTKIYAIYSADFWKSL